MRSQKSADRRRSLITGLLALGIFLALHPLVLEHFSTRFLGGAVGDGGLYVWLVQSFINEPLQALTFETNTLYPYPITRAWSDPFFLPSFMVLLFIKIGLSLPAAYNSVLLLTFASNAVACSLLAQRVGITPALATTVGVLFANSSYLVGNIGHPQLLFFFWIPLAWWCVLPASIHERAPARQWGIAGLCVVGAFFCAVYYAIFAVIGLAVIWFRDMLHGRFSSRRALRTVLFAAIGTAPLFYALPPYLAIKQYFGERGLHEAEHFAATGLSYLAFAPLHDIFGGSASLSHSEAYLSPGYAISLFAIWAIVASCWRVSRMITVVVLIASTTLLVASSVVDQANNSEQLVCTSAWVILIAVLALTTRNPSAMGSFAIITIIFLVFSFGPGGNPHKHEPSFAPLGLLFAKVPGLAAVRAVGRYGSVVILGALIAAALWIQRYIASDQRRRLEIPPVAASAVFLIFGLLENLVTTIPFDAPIPPPMAFRSLSADSSARGATLILPFAQRSPSDRQDSWSKIALLNSRYALWQSIADNRNIWLVNGYSGQRSKIQMQLPRATQNFPDSTSLNYFARLCGLRYILVVPNLFSDWNTAAFSEKLSENATAFSAVQQFEDGSMLLTLASRALTAHDESLQPFFAPSESPVRFSITPNQGEQCTIAVTSLGKSASGGRIALQSSQHILTREQSITVTPPPGLSQASPHIIELQVQGCHASTRCEATGLSTTR